MSKNILNNEHNVLNMRAIKKQNLPYILVWIIYYAWVIAFTTWWTSQPGDKDIAFSAEFRNLVHIVNLFSSVICMCCFKKNWFAATVRIGAVAAVVSMALYIAAPAPQAAKLFTVLLGASMGCVNISILIPFTFILNNTEKLVCVIISHALSNIITLSVNRLALSGIGEVVPAACILAVSLAAAPFFRRGDIDIAGETEDKLITYRNARSAAAVTLLASTVGAVLFLGTGKAAFNAYLASAGYNIATWYYIGGLAGCLIYALIFILTKKSIHMTFTIPFGCLAIGFLYRSLSDQAQYAGIIFGLLLGAGTATGMSTVYYVLGIVGKKYNSMLYLRLSIGVIGICGGVSGVLLGNTIASSPQMIIAGTVGSMIAVVLVLVLSPTIAVVCFDESWAGDLTQDEITALKQAIEVSEKTDISEAPAPIENESYVLTPDEQRIAMLLIEGDTPRDISRKLDLKAADISYSISSIRSKISKGEYDSDIDVIVRTFKLTRRETDILKCLQRDMTNQKIAEELFISEETVRIHVRNLMKKIPVERKQDVASWVSTQSARSGNEGGI